MAKPPSVLPAVTCDADREHEQYLIMFSRHVAHYCTSSLTCPATLVFPHRKDTRPVTCTKSSGWAHSVRSLCGPPRSYFMSSGFEEVIVCALLVPPTRTCGDRRGGAPCGGGRSGASAMA